MIHFFKNNFNTKYAENDPNKNNENLSNNVTTHFQKEKNLRLFANELKRIFSPKIYNLD